MTQVMALLPSILFGPVRSCSVLFGVDERDLIGRRYGGPELCGIQCTQRILLRMRRYSVSDSNRIVVVGGVCNAL